MNELKQKLASRKFWLALAAFLGSVGSSIAGIATQNETLAAFGVLCATLSAGIYAAAEAYVDSARLQADVTYTQKQVTATATDKATVQQVMGTEAKEI